MSSNNRDTQTSSTKYYQGGYNLVKTYVKEASS